MNYPSCHSWTQFSLPKRRQIQMSLGAVLLTAGLLAGCGGGSDDAAPTDTPAAAAATDTPAAVATDTPEPAATDTPEPAAASETETMTETTAMTETESMTGTETMTETEGMTETETMTATEGMTETSSSGMDQNVVESVTLGLAEDADLGSILVDQNGMTLYIFDKDEEGKSNCIGGCLEKWPPVLVANMDGVSTDSEELTAEVGTIDADNGAYQVTYAGHPLYYYAQDTKAGDASGQGVGEAWWVVGADGQAIGK